MQYVSFNTCAGLNKGSQLIVPINSQAASYLGRCENFRISPDLASMNYATPTIGMITKSPAYSNYKKVIPASSRTRGLFQFLPTVGVTTGSFLMAFQCTTDYTVGTMYALDIDNNLWKTLLTTVDPYHASFAQFENKVYIGMSGNGYFRKWWHGDTSWETTLPIVKDKGGTAATFGATLTWNGTATVTSSTDISATISAGDWIRRSSTSLYWDEVKSVAAGGLTITLITASSDSGASGVGASEYAPVAMESGTALVFAPTFVCSFKNKLWGAKNSSNSLYFSRLTWSVTGDPENWSGDGAGYMDVGPVQGESITGLAVLDDYLFVFKDFSYYVYRWTGDLDEPIELVRKFDYGCVSHRTIQNIGTVLVYCSGGDVRMTNGNEDISIAGEMEDYFKTNISAALSSTYFSLGTADNGYPWAIHDKTNNLYSLYFPNGAGSKTLVYHYDYLNKKWVGMDYYYDAGHGVNIYSSSTLPIVIFATMNATTQLKQLANYGGDITTSGYLESAALYSGNTTKKLKIYWVQFDFHPILSAGTVDTDVKFNYRQDFKAIDTTKVQTYEMDYDVATNLDRAYITVLKRFPVNLECQYFSWYLYEAFGGSAIDDIGLVSWTIAYDLLDTV